jgi:hypothetical protein
MEASSQVAAVTTRRQLTDGVSAPPNVIETNIRRLDGQAFLYKLLR